MVRKQSSDTLRFLFGSLVCYLPFAETRLFEAQTAARGRKHRKPHDGSLAIVSTICFRIIMAVLIYIPHVPQISRILFAHEQTGFILPRCGHYFFSINESNFLFYTFLTTSNIFIKLQQ